MNAHELFKQGKLSEAIADVTNHLKSKPSDTESRLFFAELLCFAKQFDRADKQFETVGQQTTKIAVTLALYRQLLRGETAREQVMREGRAPELVGALPPYAEKSLEALVALRLKQTDEAIRLMEEAQQVRPMLAATCNGNEVADFGDLDDRVAGVMEVITSTGKYFWVPMQLISSMEFEEPEVPTDLIWRKAQISVRGGPVGEVYIPTRYVADDQEDEAMLMGRATDWSDDSSPIITGRGQRMFAADEQELSIMELQSLSFAEAAT